MLDLKIVHHFLHVKQEINDVFVEEAKNIYIELLMYNLIKYNDNYSDTQGKLKWEFKRDKPPVNNVNLVVVDNNLNSESFKHKAALVEKTKDAANKKAL